MNESDRLEHAARRAHVDAVAYRLARERGATPDEASTHAERVVALFDANEIRRVVDKHAPRVAVAFHDAETSVYMIARSHYSD